MSDVYDVCVIGSGPAGGVLSKELAEAGAKVVLIEAGRLAAYSDFHFHALPYEFPKRMKPKPGYSDELDRSVHYQDSDKISVDRIRVVGGRSIHWNAGCFRWAEWDFRERTLEGVEQDWPLTYAELAPFYSYVEKMIGVTGSRENLAVLPDGEFLPPLPMRCSDLIVKRACESLGIPFIPTRKALLTQAYDHRPPCHYCGHCMEGCDVGAIFSVPAAMLPKARKTGNFELLENQLAREILVDREGHAKAVSVIHTVTREERQIRAKRFALCCATIESPRLLLNSRSPRHPNGLANSSDQVGRNLHGHTVAQFISYLDELAGAKPVNNDGALDHTYIPRFNMNDKTRTYVGGFQFQNQFYGFRYPYHAPYVKGPHHAARLLSHRGLWESTGPPRESRHCRSVTTRFLRHSFAGDTIPLWRKRHRALERYVPARRRNPRQSQSEHGRQYHACPERLCQPRGGHRARGT